MMLEPLIAGAEQRVYDRGRYRVQLDIPFGSSLTSGEVDRILRLASWETPPTRENVDGYEGGRAVLIQKERAHWRRGVQLGGLQISGIGYSDVAFLGEVCIYNSLNPFYPPSQGNFMDRVGSKMATTFSEEGRFVTHRPQYRALGTYLEEELQLKVEKTYEASLFHLSHLVTPSVEAYGRYLDPEFSSENRPFGFMVFPIPRGLE